jgi:hypothetical protein
VGKENGKNDETEGFTTSRRSEKVNMAKSEREPVTGVTLEN